MRGVIPQNQKFNHTLIFWPLSAASWLKNVRSSRSPKRSFADRLGHDVTYGESETTKPPWQGRFMSELIGFAKQLLGRGQLQTTANRLNAGGLRRERLSKGGP